jgi:hypothetical protein
VDWLPRLHSDLSLLILSDVRLHDLS